MRFFFPAPSTTTSSSSSSSSSSSTYSYSYSSSSVISSSAASPSAVRPTSTRCRRLIRSHISLNLLECSFAADNAGAIKPQQRPTPTPSQRILANSNASASKTRPTIQTLPRMIKAPNVLAFSSKNEPVAIPSIPPLPMGKPFSLTGQIRYTLLEKATVKRPSPIK
ncbi:MAG: hypothetical protein FVQ79_03760, partial [Planctomycetes bacterium]|nr:hypothetical protein [Planctomycetota bacterium]